MFAGKIKNRTVERLAFEFYMMLSRYHSIDGRYRETRGFRKLFKIAIYEILQNNEDAAPIIHQCLKDIFLEPFTRVGIYKQIGYILLPALWKDHRAIERKKQNKLNFLIEVLDEAGRHTEDHVVRVIVKPYILMRTFFPNVAKLARLTAFISTSKRSTKKLNYNLLTNFFSPIWITKNPFWVYKHFNSKYFDRVYQCCENIFKP